jgi:broad specificity phosphatase PhoE
VTNDPLPQGESREDVLNRLRRLLPTLGPGPVVLVTHGDVIAAAMTLLTSSTDGPPANGCVIRITTKSVVPLR